MKKIRLNTLAMFGLTGMFIFGSIFAAQIIQIAWGNRDIWWTPDTKKLSLQQSTSRFELSIAGKTLQQHLDNGTLLGIDDAGKHYRIVESDIKVRVNNWDEVKDSMLSSALFSAFCTGAALACFLIGIATARKSDANP